jgi:hypothetical protein
VTPAQLEADVDVLTPAEVDEAVEATLAALGMTYDELAAEAARGEFRSEQARLTWLMVAPNSAGRT